MKAIAIDQRWVMGVAQKDEKAFEHIYALYKDNVYTIALAYMEDAVEAEAIVLEVFLRVWRAEEKLLAVTDFNAWIYTITKNCSLTALKKETLRRKREMEFLDHNSTNYAEQDVYEKDMQRILQAALDQLTPQQRKIFELSRLQGYDRAAIAKSLGIAPATVSAHLTIALNAVKTFLKKNAKNIPSIFF
jgi:RNA polymerase sigma-70 factor, ECF subfamily